MRKAGKGFIVLVAVACWTLPAGADYYATKADEKAGRLTSGKAPAAQGLSALLAGGDACPGTTIAAGSTTYADSGTTIGANNTVTSIQSGCSNYMTNAGPDVVYTFDLGPLGARTASLAITVTPSGGYDASIYTLSTAGAGCPAGTANAATNCVNGSDAAGANGVETITDAKTDAMAAGTYFLFVDSFYSTGTLSAGAYSLTMNRPLPVELLNFEIK